MFIMKSSRKWQKQDPVAEGHSTVWLRRLFLSQTFAIPSAQHMECLWNEWTNEWMVN